MAKIQYGVKPDIKNMPAQVARGHYFVHELTSEVNSRMECVMKIMAISGTRIAVADLCMFGLPACDKGGPGFVNVSVRRITNVRRTIAEMHGYASARPDRLE